MLEYTNNNTYIIVRLSLDPIEKRVLGKDLDSLIINNSVYIVVYNCAVPWGKAMPTQMKWQCNTKYKGTTFVLFSSSFFCAIVV